jgi:hypothetical protein
VKEIKELGWGWLVIIAAVLFIVAGGRWLLITLFILGAILFGLVRFVKWAWEWKS